MSNVARRDGEPNQIYQLLAYYDARQVPDGKLVQIFRCTAEQLAEARTNEEYQEFLQSETAQIVNQNAELDDAWDSVEKKAVSSLNEIVDGLADPRTLLGIAVRANTAQRRAGVMAKAQQRFGAPVIDATAGSGGTRVVRMRTRFLERLQKPDGTDHLVERETEIVASDQGDLNEVISPGRMKSLMRNTLGVDPTDMAIVQRHGADAEITLNFDDLLED